MRIDEKRYILQGISTTGLDLATVLAPPYSYCLSLHSKLQK
jgi:hypothetical protein